MVAQHRTLLSIKIFGEIRYDKADWHNPNHGTHNDRYPENCKGFQADQRLLIKISECPQPSSSAFNIQGTTNSGTVTAENVDSLYQQTLPSIASNPPLLAANPYFNNDDTWNNNILSFAPSDTDTLSNVKIFGGTEAQTQDWPTNLFGDRKDFTTLEKRARKSPRDFR